MSERKKTPLGRRDFVASLASIPVFGGFAAGWLSRKARADEKRRTVLRGLGMTEEAGDDAPRSVAKVVRKDKLRKTVSLGAPQGPCGRISVLRRQIPVKRPALGRWTLQVDNQPFYSAEPVSVFVRLAITVRRVLRPTG